MDGGSLDLVMKKRGKIEEQYSRKITYAVSALLVFVHNWLKPLTFSHCQIGMNYPFYLW